MQTEELAETKVTFDGMSLAAMLAEKLHAETRGTSRKYDHVVYTHRVVANDEDIHIVEDYYGQNGWEIRRTQEPYFETSAIDCLVYSASKLMLGFTITNVTHITGREEILIGITDLCLPIRSSERR